MLLCLLPCSSFASCSGLLGCWPLGAWPWSCCGWYYCCCYCYCYYYHLLCLAVLAYIVVWCLHHESSSSQMTCFLLLNDASMFMKQRPTVCRCKCRGRHEGLHERREKGLAKALGRSIHWRLDLLIPNETLGVVIYATGTRKIGTQGGYW